MAYLQTQVEERNLLPEKAILVWALDSWQYHNPVQTILVEELCREHQLVGLVLEPVNLVSIVNMNEFYSATKLPHHNQQSLCQKVIVYNKSRYMECTNIEPKTYKSGRVQTTPWCKAQLIGVSKGGQWSRHLWEKIERRSPKEWYLGRCMSLIHRYSRRSPKSLRACHRCTCWQPSPRLTSWCCHSSPLQQELLDESQRWSNTLFTYVIILQNQPTDLSALHTLYASYVQAARHKMHSHSRKNIYPN